MPAPAAELEPSATEVRVPMPDVVRFIRQLSHDLRNQLNAAELQSAYLNEIAEDDELKSELRRLREMLTEMSGALQRLTTSIVIPKLTQMEYDAGVFLEDFEKKISKDLGPKSAELEWKVNAGAAVVCIDPQILQQALQELISNAFEHGRGAGKIRVEAEAKDELRITLIEPKSGFAGSTEDWGREPFRKLRHGHYGLGLHRARNIIEAHLGRLEARHDPAASTLITTVVLPIVSSK